MYLLYTGSAQLVWPSSSRSGAPYMAWMSPRTSSEVQPVSSGRMIMRSRKPLRYW